MAEHARPDPLQVAARWSEVIKAKGDSFASVIDARINAFNQGRTDSVNIQPNERAFIKLYPDQADEFLKLLNYHCGRERCPFQGVAESGPLSRNKSG